MKTRILIGISIILLGMAFLLDGAFGVDIGNVLMNWWPLVLIAIGLSQLKESANIRNPIMLLGLGLFFLLSNFGLLPGNFWRNLIAIIFIISGIYVLTSYKSFRSGKSQPNDMKSDLSITSIFSGNHHIENNVDFKNGNALAVFGGAEIDFRNSDITNEAFLDITCLFGGVEMKVPENWEIRIQGTPVFGGLENKTINKTKNSEILKPVLNISYIAIFGGISIKN